MLQPLPPPPPTPPSRTPWQQSLARAVRNVGELLELVGLQPEDLEGVDRGHLDFPLRVPRSFIDRMGRADPADPLLLQVLPQNAERVDLPAYSKDPLGEGASSPVPGLLHKYHGRVLLLVVGACGIHCRYCFRRHFPYEEHRESDWRGAIEYIAAQPTVHEVILSGGDPLTVKDDRLAYLAEELAAIPHLRRLRVHTRMPIVLPERVDDALLAWMQGTRLRPVMVVHSNHANEIDDGVRRAMARLRNAGITVLNQAVVLRGINDSVPALRALSETLFEAGVLPYYLSVFDPVAGAAHFDLEFAKARSLVWKLSQELPGYLVPRLVQEVAGAPAKMPVPLKGPSLTPALSE